MKPNVSRILAVFLLVAASSFASAAVTITDDFNDGNDSGWSRQSSLAGFGAAGVFTFPGGSTYQMSAPASPNPGALGPARTGSVRIDQSYDSSFIVQADIVGWDAANPRMAMGLIARGANFGLGTTNGYFLALSANGLFDINRTTNEANTTLPGGITVLLDVNADYRLIFSGDGSSLSGRLFNLTDLVNPIATINAVDSTYSSGVSGLFVFDGSPTGNQTATAVFDNYVSAIPEPASLSILGIGFGLVAVRRRRLA
jgi:hypothetical protein